MTRVTKHVPKKSVPVRAAVKKPKPRTRQPRMHEAASKYTFATVLVFCAALLMVSMILALRVRQNAELRSIDTISALDKGHVGISVNKVTYDTTGIPNFWVPTDAEQFVIVDMDVTNSSDQTVHFSPVTVLSLFGPDGAEYKVTAAPNMRSGLGGPISPGATATGEVGFLAPRQTGLQLRIVMNGVDKTIPLDTVTPGTN